MNASNIFNKLKEAYMASTRNKNYFADALDSIKWDCKFYADNEYYFIKCGFTFTTTSLDPFETEWNPEALFADGSMVSF